MRKFHSLATLPQLSSDLDAGCLLSSCLVLSRRSWLEVNRQQNPRCESTAVLQSYSMQSDHSQKLI